MNRDPHNFPLPITTSGDTWDGCTWALVSVTEGDTEFAGTLTLAEFEIQDNAGKPVLTLSSSTAGQVTIENSAPNAWSVTVEGRILDLPAGTYTYGLRLTDDAGRRKTVVSGILPIKAPPVI